MTTPKERNAAAPGDAGDVDDQGQERRQPVREPGGGSRFARLLTPPPARPIEHGWNSRLGTSWNASGREPRAPGVGFGGDAVHAGDVAPTTRSRPEMRRPGRCPWSSHAWPLFGIQVSVRSSDGMRDRPRWRHGSDVHTVEDRTGRAPWWSGPTRATRLHGVVAPPGVVGGADRSGEVGHPGEFGRTVVRGHAVGSALRSVPPAAMPKNRRAVRVV